MSNQELALFKRMDRMEREIEHLEQLFVKVFKETETLRRRFLRLNSSIAAARLATR